MEAEYEYFKIHTEIRRDFKQPGKNRIRFWCTGDCTGTLTLWDVDGRG